MSNERLLLCRPLGGLNDVLTQIERACRYAERFDRTVVVDTRHSTLYVRDTLSAYFASRQERLVLDAEALIRRADDLEVFPRFLAGRVASYTTHFDQNLVCFVEDQTGLAPSFDFGRDYDEPLIVHQSSGGGGEALAALARLRIREPLLASLLERLGEIGRPYGGVHVRNTDYKTRYEGAEALGGIDPNLPIFLATDNRDAVEYFRSRFGAGRIHAFAKLPAVAGERLHHIDDPDEAFQRNSDSILDLIMLALASRLYLFELQPNRFNARLSGFSILAANLHNAKPVLRRLISDDKAVIGAMGLAED